jgi:hypothetical protein
MLSPISVNEVLLLRRATHKPALLFALAVSRVNGLRNALLGDAAPSRDFLRVAELFGQLQDAGILDYVEDLGAESGSRYLCDIHSYANGYGDSVREFLDLLGIEVESDGSTILLPMRQSLGPSTSSIHVNYRSAHEILQLFAAGIDVPADHLEARIVEPVGAAMAAHVPFIRVRSSEGDWWGSRPDEATVAVRHRDRWFYIDETDTDSKRAFVFLRTLIGMRLAESATKQRAPLLTVPVN